MLHLDLDHAGDGSASQANKALLLWFWSPGVAWRVQSLRGMTVRLDGGRFRWSLDARCRQVDVAGLLFQPDGGRALFPAAARRDVNLTGRCCGP
jgi:hypothetical protein